MADQLTTVLSAIDAANAADPKMEPASEGLVPAALLYGRRMSQVLADYEPDAPPDLQIAVRGQHIERWLRPREDYPAGREGYLRWRKDAAHFHARRVTALMADAGFDEAIQQRVASLLLKKDIKTDAGAQTLEDVACLVFLRWYAGAFAAAHEASKVLPIVSKTARKMSLRGRQAAQKFELPPEMIAALKSEG